MDDCEQIIEQLHHEADAQLSLAMYADASAVAAMHIDLAAFAQEQLRCVEELCP